MKMSAMTFDSRKGRQSNHVTYLYVAISFSFMFHAGASLIKLRPVCLLDRLFVGERRQIESLGQPFRHVTKRVGVNYHVTIEVHG